MIANLLRKIFPEKPVVDDRYRSEMQDNRSYAVASRRESQRTLRQLEETKERLPVPTGNVWSDLYRGVTADD